ncbi:mandelate racemase/muconate lactonizing enzyme family protein [Paraburkholderia sp. FT54]|uniref:mandelate racemase/muconate lactonizing enzyme family protein n=1 Tax=Paraburkholderia sp. FT54 TaxID=3074437 RepID=UPI0028780E8F|nr:mandelate racemase/muconate lactonizing enzyme family protein [Paraburkholderia sp. FT54]WNC94985.1 mandelate racemase/muconate lactonizing enzyme family protein [Paraburkholderia sp. FT54]
MMMNTETMCTQRLSLSDIKITSIVAAPLLGQSPKGGWSAEIRPEDSIHALIAVHTDAGITGYGSVFTDGRLVQAALLVLEPLFRGESAIEPERVSEKLRQNTFWMGRGGTLTHTISGIDIALWDILGKATRMPVSRLLGGNYRKRVQPYCSLLMEEPEKMHAVVSDYRNRGFRAYKIGWGPFGRARDHKLDEAIVAAAREAAGPTAKLFVDAGASDAHWPHGLKWALRTAHMLSKYQVEWFEEPLRPDALADYIELRKASPVPIAGGEVLTRRQSFLPWLAQGAFDIVQPDVTKAGGISEQRRIAWMADDFGVKYVGHGWNTALGLAADLQMAAAFPNVDYVEFIGGSPYVDGITVAPFTLDDEGHLTIPDSPGLGVELDPHKLAQFTADPRSLFQR